MFPYKLLLTYYVWRIVWRHAVASCGLAFVFELPWRPFLGHQAWSWITLRRGNVFYYVYKRVFIFVMFLRFNVFLFFTSMVYDGLVLCLWEHELTSLCRWFGQVQWKSGVRVYETGLGFATHPRTIVTILGFTSRLISIGPALQRGLRSGLPSPDPSYYWCAAAWHFRRFSAVWHSATKI